MVKHLSTTVLLFVVTLWANGNTAKFPVSEIPDNLKKEANAVVREDNLVVKIVSRSNVVVSVHFAITILNSKGNQYARQQLWYSKLRKINAVAVAVYDASGNEIKKVKSSEIKDHSAYDGYTLYSDTRVKLIDVNQNIYPYTVEYTYEIEYKYLYSLSGTYLVPGEKVAAQHVAYKLIYPSELKPRYRLVNISQEPQKENLVNGVESLSWSFENIEPITFESMGPGPEEVIPHIEVAPTAFEYEGYAGNMGSWETYGAWIASLNKDRDQLPEPAIQQVKALTQGVTSVEEKARALYHYLQSRTRYVNISLGIGGLQPFDAATVDKNGYGDCKALSNYMVALLKAAGVKAYYAVVMAGDDPPAVSWDFPGHQANHVIVAVPNGQDTLWLECTSQITPFAYMGKFTGNRKALMITEQGGKIVSTPRYPTEKNVQARIADVYLEESGDAKALIRTSYSGLQYENDNLNHLLDNRYDDQRKWIQRNTQIPSFDIDNFAFKNAKDKIPAATLELNLTLRKLAPVSGKRFFLTPNLMNRSGFMPSRTIERKMDIVVDLGYVDTDTIRYHLPENIYPEFLPDPVKITSSFGEYENTIKLEQGNLVYIRRIKINEGRFPSAAYQEFADFYRNVNKADNIKIVFMNKT